MSSSALLVSQSGRLTPGLSALAEAQGHKLTARLVSDRPDHGRYYLSPATIRQVEQHITAPTDEFVVIVDGEPHLGQLVDLQMRLGSVTVVDRRRVAWQRLAGNNPMAAIRISLHEARLAHRRAANAQRKAATRSPSGTSGYVAHSEKRIQTLRDRLEQQQDVARRQARSSYTAVDATVVLLGRIGAPTTPLWSELTGREATAAVGLPARPTTAQLVVGPHTVGLTDTPGILTDDGVPQWLEDVLPDLTTALEEATCVLGVGDDHTALLLSVGDRFETPCRSLSQAEATEARTILDEFLPTVTCAIRLPYGDDPQALVSELHDSAVVTATEYDDAIYLRIEIAQTTITELHRQVTAVGGELKRLDTSVDVEWTETVG